MSDHQISHRTRYRIAVILCLAALALLFGSASWIMGRNVKFASAQAAETASPAQTVTTEKLHDSMATASIVAIAKADRLAAPHHSLSEPAKPAAILASVEKVVPEAPDILLGAPKTITPWFDAVSGAAPSVGAVASAATQKSTPSTGSVNLSGKVGGIASRLGGIASGLGGKMAGLGK